MATNRLMIRVWFKHICDKKLTERIFSEFLDIKRRDFKYIKITQEAVAFLLKAHDGT
jgi:hypothetical protein